MFAKLGYASESDRKNDEFVREALHVGFITVSEFWRKSYRSLILFASFYRTDHIRIVY